MVGVPPKGGSGALVGALATLVVVGSKEGAVGTVLGGPPLTVEVVATDVPVETRVVEGGREVVDDDVDDVSSGRVDSDRVVVVVSGLDVVELVVDDGCELLVGGNEVGNSVEGGTVLVVVSGKVVVGHGSTILVVVSSIKDVVLDEVGGTRLVDASKSYRIPERHASGLPQQTPARSRYQPGSSCIDKKDCNPNQSSLAASSPPSLSYSHSIGSENVLST